MIDLEKLVNAREIMFACDKKRRIVYWNESTERLLGHKASDTLGKSCFSVLDGRDVFGNRFCDSHCAIRNMIRRDEPIRQLQLNLRSASSGRINALVSAFVVSANDPSDYWVVHKLQPVGLPAHNSIPSMVDNRDQLLPGGNLSDGKADPVGLTDRESEILRLLAAGSTTREIVSQLSISEDTVRTHIRNILRKLDVHSRLEAVCLANRRRLL